MTPRSLLAAAGVAAAALALVPAASAGGPVYYVIERRAVLPSTDTDWDYAKMAPGDPRLFIARDDDGLTVFDTKANKVTATVANSKGANGPILIPDLNRGYVANTDGSLLSFDLKTLKPIERIQLDDGGLNSGVYDPRTGRLHVITGTRPKEATWFTLDARTGKLLSKKTFPFRKMDDFTFDADGTILAPARKDNLVLRLDPMTLEEKGRFSVECNISKVRYQASTRRVLATCVGDNPNLLAIDPVSGRTVAKVPVGKGLDALMIDETRGRIVTASGPEGTFSVVAQKGPDSLELLGSVSTEPGARMAYMDAATGKIFLVNADYTDSAPDASGKTSRTYHPDSFSVTTYRPVD